MNIFVTVMRIPCDILLPSGETRREMADLKRKAASNKFLFTPGTEFLGNDIRCNVDRVGGV